MPSLAEEFFKRITADGLTPADFLKTLVGSTPPTFEEEWLDFKGNPRNDDDLREHWSKALSAFSNTEGGVLIWGIDARRDATTGIDAAQALNLIPNPTQHESRLRQLLTLRRRLSGPVLARVPPPFATHPRIHAPGSPQLWAGPRTRQRDGKER